jgi:hypothetical protein
MNKDYRVSFRSLLGIMAAVLVTASLMLQAQEKGQQGQGQQGQGQQGGRAGAPQGGAPQGRGFTNLQILPKDIGFPQLVGIMQAFENALGVDCSYCHEFQGRGNPMNNFASDDKRPKKIARIMMTMARDLNMKLGMELGKPADEVTQVRCATCHRGSPIPRTEPVGAAPPAPAGGAPGGGRG